MKAIVVIMLTLLISSCVTHKRCLYKFPPAISKSEVRNITVKETVRDTFIDVRSDSSSIAALLECDSLGQVRLKQLQDIKTGSKLKPPILALNNNILAAKCEVDSYLVYLSLKDIYTSDSSVNVEIKEIPINHLTGWQWYQVWMGRIFMFFLGVGLVWLIFKIIKYK